GGMRNRSSIAEERNRRVRAENAELLRRHFKLVKDGLPEAIASGDKTLEEHLAGIESMLVSEALRCCGGHRQPAARMLGISQSALEQIVERNGLSQENQGGELGKR